MQVYVALSVSCMLENGSVAFAKTHTLLQQAENVLEVKMCLPRSGLGEFCRKLMLDLRVLSAKAGGGCLY